MREGFKQTEVGWIPEEWKTKFLGEIADLKKGFAFKSKDYQSKGRRIVKVTNFTSNSIDIGSCVCIDEEKAKEYERYQLKSDDIIITTVGSWPSNPESVVGKVIKVPQDAHNSLLNQNCVRLRTVSGANQKYLYYVLKNDRFKNYLISGAQGSANQASITQKLIQNYILPFPEIDEQLSMTSTLACLDDKIELNNQINKTLEEMAQAIFKSWFIDFEPFQDGEFVNSELGKIPKGWREGTIGEVATNIKKVAKPEEMDGKENYFGLDNMPRKCIALSEWSKAEEISSNKYTFKTGDILFGKLRPYFHKVGVAPVNGVCSTDILVITPKVKKWFGLLLFHISSNDFVDYTNAYSAGTKMPRTNWKDMSRYKILIPSDDVVCQYNDIVEPIINQIRKNILESKTLAQLRDTLLPKLMSGEIRVPTDA